MAPTFVGEGNQAHSIYEQNCTILGGIGGFPAGSLIRWLMGTGRFLGRTGSRRHVEEIIAHAVLWILFLQRVMVDHDHLIVFFLANGKALRVLVDLMRLEFQECPVERDIRHGTQEGLLSGFILEGDE